MSVPVNMFAFCSPIMDLMWNLPESRMCDYLVVCKRCGESVPAPVETMPSSWIVTTCPLCGEKRRYLPPDIFQGKMSMQLIRKPVRREAHPWVR
jgi:hypothetical protein